MKFVFAVLGGLALCQVGMLLVSVRVHRSQAHGAVVFCGPVAYVLDVALWLVTGMDQRRWVAVHRLHHAFPDKPGDPHSPYIQGFWPILMGDSRDYRRAANNKEVVRKYASDIVGPPRWSLRRFHSLGPILVGVALLAVGGVKFALIALVIHLGCGKLLRNTLASVGHRYGKRPSSAPGTNNWWLAVLTAGEGLHNNHHRRVRSPRFAHRRTDPDLGWLLIGALAWAGLAELHYVPTQDSRAQ